MKYVDVKVRHGSCLSPVDMTSICLALVKLVPPFRLPRSAVKVKCNPWSSLLILRLSLLLVLINETSAQSIWQTFSNERGHILFG